MLKKAATYIIIIIAFIIGVSCTMPLTLFIARMRPTDDPIIWSIACGVLGIIIPLVASKAIQPDLGRLFKDKPLFGKVSIRIYFFIMV